MSKKQVRTKDAIGEEKKGNNMKKEDIINKTVAAAIMDNLENYDEERGHCLYDQLGESELSILYDCISGHFFCGGMTIKQEVLINVEDYGSCASKLAKKIEGWSEKDVTDLLNYIVKTHGLSLGNMGLGYQLKIHAAMALERHMGMDVEAAKALVNKYWRVDWNDE